MDNFKNNLVETINENVKLNAIQKGTLSRAFENLSKERNEYKEISDIIGEKEIILDYWIMPNFTIVKVKSSWMYKDRPENEKFHYTTILDGRDCSQISYSFDEQLLISMGLKYDGLNSQFSGFACRMLDIDKKYQD